MIEESVMPGLLNGQWVKGDVADGEIKGGAFEREPTKFRHWLTPDGEPGPEGQAALTAEAGRYGNPPFFNASQKRS